MHQLDLDTDDRKEHEDLILEGSLQEPQDLEAEADHFMYSILQRDGLGAKVWCGSWLCLASTLLRASTASAGLVGSRAPPSSVLSSVLLISLTCFPPKAARGCSCPCTSLLAWCLLLTDPAFPSPVLFSVSVCSTWVMSCLLSLWLPQEEVQVRVPKLEVSGSRMGAQIVKRASLKRGKH